MRSNIFWAAQASLLLTLAACESEPQFRIKGEIAEAADRVLYFEAAALDGIKVLDSVRLDKNGGFEFRYKRPESPDFYRLRVGERVINLGIDSTETVTVKAGLPTMTTGYSVEGSEESLRIKELASKQTALQQQIRQLAGQGLAPGDFRDSVERMVESYKEYVKGKYIYPDPRSGAAYYALFQRINGSLIFNPETDREDIRAFGAVANSWHFAYPHSLRAANLYNIALRGMRNTRKSAPSPIPEEKITEVTLFDLSLPDLKGNLRTLTELKGKVVMLDFTVYQNQASPARNLLLRELYDLYGPRGLEIYQVSFDLDEHFWKTSADNLPWICVRDADRRSAQTYHVTDLPTYFLIDRDNGLYKRNIDIKDYKQLKEEIEKLL